MLSLGLSIAAPAVLSNTIAVESLAIFASFTTPPSAIDKANINALVRTLKSAGVWSELDILYVIAAADSQAARVNWKNPGAKTLSVLGAPVFTSYRGYAGNGSSAVLDTGWAPSVDGVRFTLNEASMWLWSRTAGTGAAVDMGALASTMLTRDGSNRTVFRLNNTASEFATSITDGSGLFGVQRTGASALKTTRNGAQTGTGSQAATGLSAASQWILAGSSLNYGARQISLAAWGASLNGKEAAFYNAVLAYLQAVGAA